MKIMAYYEYTPAKIGTGQPETLDIVGASDTDAASEQRRLINQAMNAVNRREFDTKERAQLAEAGYEGLPASLVSRLVKPEVFEPQVMQAGTGLAMYAPEGDDTPSFALFTEEIDDDFQMLELAEEGVDPDTFNHLVGRREVTRTALQYQPVREEGRLRLRLHHAFGQESVEGGYRPIVTVLSAEHPVRQQIDQNNS